MDFDDDAMDFDDPALAHLRDDAPYVVCSACGRKSWGGDAAGSRCGMTQPSGASCDGVFGLPQDAEKDRP
jgi:hypothetical protein